uniref:Uncharacterized protein n=1 Tax=Meloidogyne incognita TaxID=6306 RepID=A0A914KT19_MELIC
MDIHVVSNTIRLNHMASSHASCFNKQTWVGATQSRQTEFAIAYIKEWRPVSEAGVSITKHN